MSETETRDEPMAGSPLCDAEGHAWVWTWPIEGGEGSIGRCSLCGRITTAERDAATRAEVVRLRGVVEAVQALADEWGLRAGDISAWPKSRIDILEAVYALRAALAPVSSSGEALCDDPLCGSDPHKHRGDSTEYVPPSSGEAEGPLAAARAEVAALWSAGAVLRSAIKQEVEHFREEAKYGHGAWREPNQRAAERLSAILAAPVGSSGEAESGETAVASHPSRCDSCNELPQLRFSPEHSAHFCQRCYARENPAPVPSGGQADGEGEDAHTLAALIREHADSVRAIFNAPMAAGSLRRVADRVETLAARPVLSREALDGVLAEVREERARQDAKWGEQNHPDGTGSVWEFCSGQHAGWAEEAADDARRRCQEAPERTWGDTYALILNEEVAEAFAEEDPTRLREELVQVAAVAVAWVEAIDRRADVLTAGGEQE